MNSLDEMEKAMHVKRRRKNWIHNDLEILLNTIGKAVMEISTISKFSCSTSIAG